MWKLNKVIWWTALAWVALETAALAWNETASAIVAWLVETAKNSTHMILNSVDLSTVSSYIAENAPLSIPWWESLIWPAMFWAAWAYLWNKSSKILWKWTWTEANKWDDNVAWVSGLVAWVWFWLWSVPLATAGLTWLSYVWSRKVFEKILPAKYVHLAKYFALAPAWAVASATGLTDGLSILAPILAWTVVFWVNKLRS